MKLALTLLSLFTLLTLYSQENKNQKDHISIIHIGSTDKFIYAINISKDSLTDDFAVTDGLYGNKTHLMARNYIVNNGVYDKIKKSILKKEKKINPFRVT